MEEVNKVIEPDYSIYCLSCFDDLAKALKESSDDHSIVTDKAIIQLSGSDLYIIELDDQIDDCPCCSTIYSIKM